MRNPSRPTPVWILTGTVLWMATGLSGGCGAHQEGDDPTATPTGSSPSPDDQDTPGGSSPTPAAETPSPAAETPSPIAETPSPDDETPSPGATALPTEVVLEGETEYGDLTCTSGDPVVCCRELHLELATTQDELETLFAAVLSEVEVPPLDFSASTALLSYTTLCPGDGNQLTVDEVLEDDSRLTVAETLTHDAVSAAVVVRPYLLVTLPAGEYTDVSGALTEVYLEEATLRLSE